MDTLLNSTGFRNVIATAVITAFGISFAGSCNAADATDTPHVTVKYSDLNLLTVPGATALYSRICAAASEVCGDSNDRTLAFKSRTDACIHKAIADVVSLIDRPTLSAVYSAKTGRPTPITMASSKGR